MLNGHGGNLIDAANLAGVRPEEILDFSASVSRFPDADLLRRWLSESAGMIGSYPDPEYRTLRRRIGERYGIDPAMVLPGNGSTELLYLLPRVLRPKKGLIALPSYADYADSLRMAGCELCKYMLLKDSMFAYDLDKLDEMLKEGCDIAIFGNPNNPTGSSLEPGALRRLAAKHSNTLFVIDESFSDYSPTLSILPDVPPNVAVLRSFTKYYGIPGLRAGFVVCAQELVGRLNGAKEPWTLNSVAESVSLRILAGELDEEGMRRENTGLRERLASSLGAIEGLKVFPSPANYLLVEMGSKGLTAAVLKKELLLRERILIRDCSNFEGLSPYWFRLAVRNEAENERLVGVVKALCTRRL